METNVKVCQKSMQSGWENFVLRDEQLFFNGGYPISQDSNIFPEEHNKETKV